MPSVRYKSWICDNGLNQSSVAGKEYDDEDVIDGDDGNRGACPAVEEQMWRWIEEIVYHHKLGDNPGAIADDGN